MFSKRLKLLRVEHGLNQVDLASDLNISRSSIANYESTKRIPDTETLIAIAKYFHVTTDWLLGLSDVREWGNKNTENYITIIQNFECELKKENLILRDEEHLKLYLQFGKVAGAEIIKLKKLLLSD